MTPNTPAAIVVCSFCEEPLTGEELENPSRDDNGNPVCYDCYCEEFQFTCCLCREYGDDTHQDNFVVVFEAEAFDRGGQEAGFGPGLYRVKECPYYGGPIIGGNYLDATALEHVGAVPDGAGGNGYPCGHLCLECQRKMKLYPDGKAEVSDA